MVPSAERPHMQLQQAVQRHDAMDEMAQQASRSTMHEVAEAAVPSAGFV